MPRKRKEPRLDNCTRCQRRTTVVPVARHAGTVVRQLLCPECLAALASSVKQPSMQTRERLDNELRKTYGLTVTQYEAMLIHQDGRCWICRERPPADRRLAVDHDHSTGRVRGLLCNACNLGIGTLGDDGDRCLRAAAYLRGVL